jgi:hypothetical protein
MGDNATLGKTVSATVLLGLIACVSAYVIYSLWSSRSWPAMGSVPSADCKANGVALQHTYPDPLSVGTPSAVLLIGCGFIQATVVKVNGATHGSTFIDQSRIQMQLSAADLASVGPLPVAMSDGKNDFASAAFDVTQPTFAWRIFASGPFQIPLELQLLLLVLFTGCFGASVYACKSLADYWGDSKLCSSWLLFYYIQPVKGAGIALLTYLCIRGGFLATGGSDVKSVNQFGICAIAGLSGAFSDIAFAKLREVFLTLFKPQDTRSDKISSQLSISTQALPDGNVGQDYTQTLSASGGTPPLQWSVTPDLPQGLNLNKDTGEITGRPVANAGPTEYTFVVKDAATPQTTASAKITFEVK